MLGYFNHPLSRLSYRQSIMQNQHENGFADVREAVLVILDFLAVT